MEVVAKAKYVRRTPRKARLVADAVIGMRVSEALAQLEFSPRHAAQDVAKVIKSAAANAEHNYNLSRDDLVVKQLLVDEGPTMKRFRPASRGMAHQYFHRTSHITAVVEDRPAPPVTRRPERRRRRAAEAEEAPKPAPRSARKPAAAVPAAKADIEAPSEAVESQEIETPAASEEQAVEATPAAAEEEPTTSEAGVETQAAPVETEAVDDSAPTGQEPVDAAPAAEDDAEPAAGEAEAATEQESSEGEES